MKRIIKILTSVLAAALILSITPHVFAQEISYDSDGVSFMLPDNWTKSSVNVLSGDVHDPKLKKIQSSINSEYTRFDVTYKDKYTYQLTKSMWYGTALVNYNNTKDYFEYFQQKYNYMTSITGKPNLVKINGMYYINCESVLYNIFIYVNSNRLYQFEFEFMDGYKETVKYIMQSANYFAPKTKEFAAPKATEEPKYPVKSARDSKPFPSLLVLLVPLGIVLAVYISKKNKEKKNNAKQSQKPVPVFFPSKPKPLSPDPPKPKAVVEAEKLNKRIEDFKKIEGYLYLDGKGFRENPGKSCLAELYLDTANGYPQVVWAYYERSPEYGNIIVTKSQRFSEEKINKLTPKLVLEEIKNSSSVIPPYVNADYEKIAKNREIATWCDTLRKIYSADA